MEATYLYDLMRHTELRYFASFETAVTQVNFAATGAWVGDRITITRHKAPAYESAKLTGAQLFKLRSITADDWVILTAAQLADYELVSGSRCSPSPPPKADAGDADTDGDD